MSVAAPPRLPGVDPYLQSAIHEIGHAVVNAQDGSEIELISVGIWEEHGHVVGEVVSEIPVTEDENGVRLKFNTRVSRENIYQNCICIAAGQVAEALFLVKQHDYSYSEALELTESTAWFDINNFRKYSRLLGGDVTLRGCRAEARQLLKARWSRVESLGAQLASARSLSPRAVG